MSNLINPAEIQTFLRTLHDHAAVLSKGAVRPGYMQLVCIRPGVVRDDVIVNRFKIGQHVGMSNVAVASAESGFNVYVEGRTVRQDLRGNVRGEIYDTTFVFAFVVDNDSDHERISNIALDASITVATSPGNTHQWLLLDKAVNGQQGSELGRRIRHHTQADGPTGNICTPFRVAGTPNYPSPSKIARGRGVVHTSVLSYGKIWSYDELGMVFPIWSDCNNSSSIDSRDFSNNILQVDSDELQITADALRRIPNNGGGLEYDDWLRVVFGLQWAMRNAESKEVAQGYMELCNKWSMQSEKYRAQKQRKTVKSCREISNPCTLATVYWMAFQYGWISSAINYKLYESPSAQAAEAARIAEFLQEYRNSQ